MSKPRKQKKVALSRCVLAGVGSTGGSTFFDSRLLARCLLTKEQARQFRSESRQRVFTDEETQSRVVCYQHPDGRVLIDAVRLHDTHAELYARCIAACPEWHQLSFDAQSIVIAGLSPNTTMSRTAAEKKGQPQ